VFVAVLACVLVELPAGDVDGVEDEATLGLAASISVMATAATITSLRTVGIIAPPVSSAGSRTTPGADDNSYVPMAAEVGMRTLADGGVD